jgi:hypothetical protein
MIQNAFFSHQVTRSHYLFAIIFRLLCVIMSTVRLSHNKDTTLSRLLTELSKIYLHSALQCTRVECENFHIISRCLLNVLLSCLYLSTKQRRSASIHIGNTVSMLQKHHIRCCHVERLLLPCFDTTLENYTWFDFILSTCPMFVSRSSTA